MSHDSIPTPKKRNGVIVLRDEDVLASYSHRDLLEEAVQRGRRLASIAGFLHDRAEGKLCAADFDKELAYFMAGEGYCHAEGMLEAFKKGDAS